MFFILLFIDHKGIFYSNVLTVGEVVLQKKLVSFWCEFGQNSVSDLDAGAVFGYTSLFKYHLL